MYADDIQLLSTFPFAGHQSAVRQVNEMLSSISKLAVSHSLNLNPTKSAVVVFGNKNQYHDLFQNTIVQLGDTRIPVLESVRDLGLHIDNSFRYRLQIKKYVGSAYASLRLLYPHRRYLSYEVKRNLCDSIVLSNFSYCAEVYHPSIDTITSNKIQLVQNSCLRFIYGIRKYSHISHKLIDINWLNMSNRRVLSVLCTYHKILTTQRPEYLMQRVSFRTDVHGLDLRRKGLLTIPAHKTSLFERSFSYNIAKFYNSLPFDFRSLPFPLFKRRVREYLFQKQL